MSDDLKAEEEAQPFKLKIDAPSSTRATQPAAAQAAADEGELSPELERLLAEGGDEDVEQEGPASWDEVAVVIGVDEEPAAGDTASYTPPAEVPTPATFEEKAAAAEEPPLPKPGPPVPDDETIPVVALAEGDIKLVIEQGMSINKEFLVNDPELLLGRRDPDQDFIPDIDLFDQEAATNRYISRRQARLYFKDGGLWLEDLESSNGTALNNHLIEAHKPRRLKPGDKILLGQSVLLRVRRVTT
jgi:hypothetical protein